jgi:hypothetical protein
MSIELLGASPVELFVASGIVLAVLLALLARRSVSANGAASDETALGKRYIDAEIDAHVGTLAARYAEMTAALGHDDPDRFRLEVESFIAQVLERDLDEPEAAELRDSVREVLVLEREYVYDRVFARIRAHRPEG